MNVNRLSFHIQLIPQTTVIISLAVVYYLQMKIKQYFQQENR